MRRYRHLLHPLTGLVLFAALAAASLLLAAPAEAQGPPVIFLADPTDPDYRVYAQNEITVDPEPPVPGEPTEICAWVINTSAVPVSVTLEFGAAPFGIGLPFGTIGQRTIVVPPGGKARACIAWVPRLQGHWCIQVRLHQGAQWDVLWSQRNIDIWEALEPGKPAVTVFPVSVPPSQVPETLVHLNLRGLREGWAASIQPARFVGMPGQVISATLVVTPPLGAMLGTRAPIVDVEAMDQTGLLIGGFRKLDSPPVPLHRFKDPIYAESEISVDPYPPLPGEPAEICVELRNLSDITRTVVAEYFAADFGIGLPFDPIGVRGVEIPPHGRAKVCINWIPPKPGHFCVQVILRDPGGHYLPQKSQRNLDVLEVLKPGAPSETIFLVSNPTPDDIALQFEARRYLPGWEIVVLPEVIPYLRPGEIQPVSLVVTPPPGELPDDGQLVADIEAYYLDKSQELVLLGGFRKIFRPPVPIHRPQEPPYAESEISVEPYPPRASEPTLICTELRNPTPFTQTVQVEFGVANFGIGLRFMPIDRQTIELPPLSRTRVCTRWAPTIGGHFCVQVVIRQPGYRDVWSQRNLDVAEYLLPGQPDRYSFPVGNPFPDRSITVTLGMIEHLPGWSAELSSYVVPEIPPHGFKTVTLTVTPDQDLTRMVDGQPVIDIVGYFDGYLLGGFRKLFRPPISIHRPADPIFAEREITIQPYPVRAGEPTEVCVELRNPTPYSQTVWVDFAWANFGIGLPFHPFHGQLLTLPPHSIIKKCTHWVPAFAGQFCIQVSIKDPQGRLPTVFSQRNLDVGEVFRRGQPTVPLVFVVGNPLDHVTDIRLAPRVHLEGWIAMVDPPFLSQVGVGERRPVTLTVLVPDAPLPVDETPVVDVEAIADGRLIGGFRKLYRPPVPIHRPVDPIYAESEISITPYPPKERQPTEICVDVRNPTNEPQTVTVTLSVAEFGIGLPFHDIAHPIVVTLAPNSIRRVCITWVPPFGGQFCARATLELAGHRPVWSQRNMDVSEVLRPGAPSTLVFPVANPTEQAITLTLGMVPYLEGWQLHLSQDVLANMLPGATREVTLTVTPPAAGPMPDDGAPVVDVEGSVGRVLIGGFRKIYRPPAPIHVPRDPVYAESEIFADPYPTLPGLPTVLGTMVFNPSSEPRQVTVTFGVANFGIGLPFSDTGILTPTMVVTVPPFGTARAKTIWIPPFGGHFCVRVWLQVPGHERFWSQRNMDVGEPLRPDQPDSRVIPVGNPFQETVTVTMALINHRPGWTASITPTILANLGPGAVRPVTLTVQPSSWEGLADERPVVDVEAYVDGRLIGGIRKLAKPPIPIHKPQDRPYAETEISVEPDPIRAGRQHTITVALVNAGPVTHTVRAEFSVANFGFGIPFTDTNIVPAYRVITLTPGYSGTAWVNWTPPFEGHWCIRIALVDPEGQYPTQYSQRNVDVVRLPYQSCQSFTRDFWLQNSSPLTVTVSIGTSAINLPAGWTYSVDPTEAVLGPSQGITVTATITPPCTTAVAGVLAVPLDTGGASGPPTIDVEGYVDGQLLGGIRIQLETLTPTTIYLPVVMRQ